MPNEYLQFDKRSRNPSPNNMEGVTIIRKKCHCCGQHRSTAGCKNVDIGMKSRAFVCGECVQASKHLELKNERAIP